MPQQAATVSPTYSERLAPSLWLIVAAVVVAPMASLVFVQMNEIIALAIGFAVAVVVIAGLILLAPKITVEHTLLRAGRASIDVTLLGSPVALDGEEARAARGTGLDANGWHLIRGGIDGIVVVPVEDPDDPTTVWTISTRTPERLAAVIERAQQG